MLNQWNVEWRDRKIFFNYINNLKKTIKDRESKLKYKINIFFDLRVKLKGKINLTKGPKNNSKKNKVQNWNNKIKLIEGWNWKKIN